jgi:hypothetical protein
MENIISIVLIIILILSIILIIRNNKVYQYRSYILKKCYNVCMAHLDSIPDFEYTRDKREYQQYLRRMWWSIRNVSYDKMMFKFWIPLKDKYWFTEEQIKFLNLTFPKCDTRR